MPEPKTASEYLDRGCDKDDKRDSKGAIEDYTKAIELDPNYAEAYANRGCAKEELGDKEGAIADRQKAADLGDEEAGKWIKEIDGSNNTAQEKIQEWALKGDDLIDALESLDNKDFPWLKGKEIEINKIPLRALRINYMGELGWELHHPMNQMKPLYDAICEVGKKEKINNFGTYAVNSLRMEKAYRGWGAELTGEISLVEASMDRFFNLNKKSNFIGSEVLRNKLQSGVDIKIVYLEVDVDGADARGNEPVYHENKIVGVVTSGAYGFRTNKSLAFAYVKSNLAKDGTELFIEIQGQKRKAKILNSPAYDSENKKLRS